MCCIPCRRASISSSRPRLRRDERRVTGDAQRHAARETMFIGELSSKFIRRPRVMASEKVSAIIESIEGLNVLELVDLKKSMEEKWGVTAAAPVAFAAAGPAVSGGD